MIDSKAVGIDGEGGQPDRAVPTGRILGVITVTDGYERGYVFAEDANGEEYFAHISTFAIAHWEGVQAGDGISFKVTETTKGWRAHSVLPATEAELDEIAGWEESRGNR